LRDGGHSFSRAPLLSVDAWINAIKRSEHAMRILTKLSALLFKSANQREAVPRRGGLFEVQLYSWFPSVL
jgi:hypothetical protein